MILPNYIDQVEKTQIISDTYKEELAKKVEAMINPSDIVVLKASRGMQLERVLRSWGLPINPQGTSDLIYALSVAYELCRFVDIF